MTTVSVRRSGDDPDLWTAPFSLSHSRNREPLAYCRCCEWRSYDAQPGDFIRVRTIRPVGNYTLRVKAGAEPFVIDYGAIEITGAVIA